MDKQQLKEREQIIVEMADAFCRERLDEECAELVTNLIRKLGRKRNNPFQTGRPEIWAAGAVYTICSINFLFAKGARLYCPSSAISEHFGTSSSTLSQKSKTIRDLLKISKYFDEEFSLQEIQDKNPFKQIRMINGFFFLE